MPEEWKPQPVIRDNVRRFDNESFVNDQAEKWRTVWGASEVGFPELEVPPEGVFEQLKPFLIDETRRAASTFKVFTATSADALRPRHVRLLSGGAMVQLNACMRNADRTGFWARTGGPS